MIIHILSDKQSVIVYFKSIDNGMSDAEESVCDNISDTIWDVFYHQLRNERLRLRVADKYPLELVSIQVIINQDDALKSIDILKEKLAEFTNHFKTFSFNIFFRPILHWEGRFELHSKDLRQYERWSIADLCTTVINDHPSDALTYFAKRMFVPKRS